MRNYKFRPYPNKVVKAELNKQLDLYRWTYNKLLEELNEAKEKLAESRPLQQRKLLQVKVLKREAPCKSVG
ncbi:MAG: helix-turn-helix domain-containing protein [Candidatus Parvarchaeum sp.]